MKAIAIKLGSAFTSIYTSDGGLVLREPTVVAMGGTDKSKIVAVGNDALSMREKSPDITVLSPVSEGIMASPDVCAFMLKAFLDKICPQSAIFRPRYEAIVGIPLGLTADERELYEEVFAEADITNVTLVPNVLLSAIGAGLPIKSDKGMLVVNIGGGRTEIALISCGGIINGCGMGVGGQAIDKAIMSYVANNFNMKISAESARKLREEVGSLYENDTANSVVSGMDVSSNVPESAMVHSYDIREVMMPYFLRICDLAKAVVKTCPPSIARDIVGGEVALTGGVSNIPGIDALFMRQLSLPVKMFDRPEFLQIIGAGTLLSDGELMKRLIDGGSV